MMNTDFTHIWQECIVPIISFILLSHLELSRIPKHPIFKDVCCVYRRRVISVLHCILYSTFSNRFDSPVAEERLWVCGPLWTVLAEVVTTRANDSGYLCIDDFLAFLVS
jgi:hypothetical protein